jgi:hypothetical protein
MKDLLSWTSKSHLGKIHLRRVLSRSHIEVSLPQLYTFCPTLGRSHTVASFMRTPPEIKIAI